MKSEETREMTVLPRASSMKKLMELMGYLTADMGKRERRMKIHDEFINVGVGPQQ